MSLVMPSICGAGEPELYLDGTLQGAAPKIAEPFAFEWDIGNGAIRLGVNYVGLMDDRSATCTVRQKGVQTCAAAG